MNARSQSWSNAAQHLRRIVVAAILVSVSTLAAGPGAHANVPQADSVQIRLTRWLSDASINPRIGAARQIPLQLADSVGSAESRPLLIPRRPSLVTPILYTTGWHVVGMAALLSMDPEETGFEPPSVHNVFRAMTKPPVWDNDHWITNYIGHPVWGSETYLTVRRNGYSQFESFLFSTASSVAWEYTVESWAEQPSIQDLLFTSTIGAVLGEIRYHMIRSLVKRDSRWSRPLLVVVDPLRGITNVTGIRMRVGMSIRPY